MSELCEYFVYFTIHLIEVIHSYPAFEEHEFSPEVVDRAVSFFGIVVPAGLYLLVLFMIALAGLCMYKAIGGRRK